MVGVVGGRWGWWVVGAGCWVLGAGCWVLGCWVLGAGRCAPGVPEVCARFVGGVRQVCAQVKKKSLVRLLSHFLSW